MKLVITEKPSVALSIAKVIGADKKENGYYSGNNYIVSWCIGHLIELDEPESYNEKFKNWKYTPIIPSNYNYKVKVNTKEQFNTLKSLMDNVEVESLICATDSGREGELIFRHVYNTAGCKKPFERLWISSLEDKSIRDGFANLKSSNEYDNLYKSALCRERADWLVGINATRYFTTLYNSSVLSIGRVQTPTLALITKRNYEIKNFVKEKYYTVEISSGDIKAVSEKIKDYEEAEKIKNICNDKSAFVSEIEKEEKVINPPKLYDLTTLQREANRLFGFSAQQTLEAAQRLYDIKLITYPRTDSQYITDDMEKSFYELVNIIHKALPELNVDITFTPDVKRCINNSKVSDHHAIIPTPNIYTDDLSTLTDTDRKILHLISNRVLSATGDTYIYEKTTALIKCCDVDFMFTGQAVKQLGFKITEEHFYNLPTSTADILQNETDKTVLELTPNMEIFNVSAETKEHFTSPPKPYTEDTLLSAMERAGNSDYDTDDVERKGLGTPATRAGIIETIIARNYVERKNKQLIPTEKGSNLIKIVPDELKSAKLTAEWENRLTRISKGIADDETFMNDISSFVREKIIATPIIDDFKNLFNTKEVIGICPRCGSNVYEGKLNFYCSDKNCSFTLWKNNKFFESKKKVLTKAVAKDLLSKGKVKMKGLYSEKTSTTYDAYILLDDTGGKYVNFKLEFINKNKEEK